MYDSVIAALEAKRKKIYPWMVMVIVSLIIAFFLTFFYPLLLIVVAVIDIILLIKVVFPKSKEFRELYKTTIVKSVFEERMQGVDYQPKTGFSKEYISDAGFMMMGNVFKSEDLITASYKNVNFFRADVKIEDETSDGENTSVTTYFLGRWIILDFNKSFTSDLQIIQNGFAYSRKKNSIFTRKDERRHKIEFENEDFNRQFTCYAENDQEAFYIVTPHLMEALIKFSTISDGKIMLGFKGNRVHLAINAKKDTLEPSLAKPVTYENDVKPVLFEAEIIMAFIDILNLDRNIFKI